MRAEWPLLARVVLAAGAACLVTLTTTPLVRRLAIRRGWVAKPVGDRWGRRIVARLGGLAIFAGLAAAIAVGMSPGAEYRTLLMGSVLVVCLGLADDILRLPPYTKLLGQLAIGCVVVISGTQLVPSSWPWLAVPMSILWFVLLMNAFNLLDNMDGLAAGIGAIGAASCLLHAALAGRPEAAILAAGLLGACLGFLRYNFPPASIFMGDSGSHLIGFVLAMLALIGSDRHSTHLISVLAMPTLLLAVPIFDTCFVTIQRLANRRSPFIGGTDHVSHRLAILGLSTRRTVVLLYLISAALGLLSVVSWRLLVLPVLAIWLSAITLLLCFGSYLARVKVYRIGPDAGDVDRRAPGQATLIETMLLHKRRLVEILVDFCTVSSVYVFSWLLRFEGTLSADVQRLVFQSFPLVLLIKLGCFGGFGLYRGVWRYLGLWDLVGICKAVTAGSVLSALSLLYLWRFEGYSRAVFIIDWALTLLAISGSRIVERLLDEWIQRVRERREPVLIIGAGDTGQMVLRCLKYEHAGSRYAIAFLDDDGRKHGARIHGCPVLGNRTRLAEVLKAQPIREVLVAINDPPGELLRHVAECCQPAGVPWRVVTAGVTEAV